MGGAKRLAIRGERGLDFLDARSLFDGAKSIQSLRREAGNSVGSVLAEWTT
jgi:hypothetical protein